MKNFYFALISGLSILGCHRNPMPPKVPPKLGFHYSQFNGGVFPLILTGDLSHGIAENPVEGLEIEYPKIAEILPSADIPAALLLYNHSTGLVTKPLDFILLQLSKNPQLLSVSQLKVQFPKEFSEGNFRVSNGIFHVVVLQKFRPVIHLINFPGYVRVSFGGRDAFFKYAK
jgi:hypothetical protein